MRTRLCGTRALLTAVLLGVAAGCSDSTAPTVDAVAGTYTATRLTTTEGGTTVNQLAEGVTLVLTLNANGTTSGRFIVPGDLDADLTGTWSLNGSTVTLNHSADTFLTDMPFRVRGNTLIGDETFAETRVRVTLTKE